MDPIAMALMGAAAIKVCKDFRDWKPPPEAYEKNPLPSNPEKLREQASHIGLLGPHVNVAAMTPKGQLFQHIFDSHNICRSTNKASIVLFGDSGTGKSSTVNHLFGTEVAAVSEDESETSETIEYKLLVDDNKFMIKDLLLSIIDTPGCNDTRGTDQDAFNTLCIKEFFEEYHGLTQNGNPVYPNMVLFLIRSDEPRLKGRNSNFSKGLRIAQYLQLIDHKNPNVIVILTRAQNILPPMENEGKLKKVKENVQEIVFKVLNIPVQIVCIENKYENLPKNGEEATELGNGELQPMNLYQAMKNLLERNGDRLGHLALNKCFENPSVVKKSTGIQKRAKTAEKEEEPFDPKVMEILDFLNRNRNTGVKMSESSIQVQKYVEQNKATEEKINALEVASALTRAGLTKDDLQSYNMESLETVMDMNFSSFSKNMMAELFGTEGKQKPMKSDMVVGRSFNVFLNKVKDLAIFDMDSGSLKESKLGFLIPEHMTVDNCSCSETIMDVSRSKKEFLKKICLAFGLDVNLSVSPLWQIESKPGFSFLSESQTVHKDEQVSFLFEQRLFKLKLEDPLAINNFSSTFKECVSKLPRTFNNDNPEKFCSFFQEWGQFLITSAYGGGSVTLNSEIRVKKEENTMDLIAGTKSILQTKFLSLSGEVSSRSEIAWNNEVAAKFLSTRAIWSGGNKALHENLSASQINPEKWTKWKNSIVAHPEMLFSEFGLYPLHTIMSKVPGNEGMSTVFEDSWKHFMGNTAPSLKSEKTEQSQSCRGTGNTRQTAVEDVPEASKNCFPRLSNALTSNGNWTTLDKLRSGDMVMVWSFSKQQLEYSPIIMFNHADNQKNGIYLKVQTEERKETLLISPNHLIFTATAGTQRSMIAAQLRIGDQILVCRQMQMVATKVINIESVEEDGLFAPITLAGTIVVDDVLASCYCNVADLELPLGLGKVDGHQLAHVGMSPFRAAYNLGFKSMLDIPKEKDMPDCIKYAVDWILPLVSV